MTDPIIPPISVPRGGIRFDDRSGPALPPMVEAGWQELAATFVAELPENAGAITALGGFCAPVSSWYDIEDRTPWTHADLPWPWHLDVERWLVPRLFAWQLFRAELRRRLGRAVAALRGAQLVEVDPDDDEWNEGW